MPNKLVFSPNGKSLNNKLKVTVIKPPPIIANNVAAGFVLLKNKAAIIANGNGAHHHKGSIHIQYFEEDRR